MIKTARQLKDLLRNLAKDKSADAQVLLRNYMMERFLERISVSAYRDNMILKGGMLVSAMVGLDARSTLDMDATVKGIHVSIKDVETMISEIIHTPLEDGVSYQVKSISEIMDEAEYPGIRVSLNCFFDGTRTPLKVDISTGDVITPQEVRYSFRLMFEERSIQVWAYNLETVMAEKLETIIARSVTNTRMRDFYDLHILYQLYGEDMDIAVLTDALTATAHKRGSSAGLEDAEQIVSTVHTDAVMQDLWENYRKKFSYAAELSWETVIGTIRKLLTEIRNIKQ